MSNKPLFANRWFESPRPQELRQEIQAIYERLGEVSSELDALSFSWPDILDKPATFPPDAHTHPIADVTDLQTDLNAKYPKAGGSIQGSATVEGNLSVSGTTSLNSMPDVGGVALVREGSFVPALSSDGTPPTVGYASRGGKYLRVGDAVFITLYIQLSSFSGGTGNNKITGLPFPVLSGSLGSSPLAAWSQDVTWTGDYLVAQAINTASELALYGVRVGTTQVRVPNSGFGSSTYIRIAGHYWAA